MFAQKAKNGLVMALEIGVFYLSLLLTLLIRYGADYKRAFAEHAEPFAIILVLWLATFFVLDLYSPKAFRSKVDLVSKVLSAVLASFLLSIVAFYAFGPFFQLAPKTNLFIFTFIFLILDTALRLALCSLFKARKFRNRIMLIGSSPTILAAMLAVKSNPHLGYEIVVWKNAGLSDTSTKELIEEIRQNNIDTVVLDAETRKNPKAAELAYELLPARLAVMDLSDFYESIFRKIPLAELSESWFVGSIETSQRSFDLAKRLEDIVLSLALLIALLPLWIVIAIAIALTSKGPAIYRQTRVGKNGREFTLYKFRTMVADAEKGGAVWAQAGDGRVTPFGRILRYTHLDEMPQLWNILAGDLSFVGPRPERPEFTGTLKEAIPYYNIRHVIKPGLTGWAQINYRYGATVEDAKEKLEYDIYYLKNKSLILDFLIILKTIRMFFQNH